MRFAKALLCGAAMTILAGGTAWAEGHAEWGKDGLLVMKLGPEYDNTVITVPKGMVGSEFGPGKKPFEGVTINITVNGAGPNGGISGPLYSFRPIWEEISGGKVNIVELPFAEHYTKMMLDVRNGTGQYDAFTVGAFWYGDIVPNGYALPIDDMTPSLRNTYPWGGVGYGVRNDADGQVLYYRRDVLNDPKNQADFKAA